MSRRVMSFFVAAALAAFFCAGMGAAGSYSGVGVGVYGGVEVGSDDGVEAGLNGRLADVLRCSEFDGASVSVLAVTASGDTLLMADQDRQLLPASNLKLVTTALALHALGPDYRFGTSLGYTGEAADGVLRGDLYVIGGGDPTLGSHNRVAEPLDSVFAQWLRMLRGEGIRRIDGYVIGDGRLFPGMREQESWQLNDCGTYYGAGVSGLNFYENELDFRVAAGAAAGDPPDIVPAYPDVPWMRIDYACSTGPSGSGNSLYFYTSPFAPYGVMRGTFALDRRPKTEGAANKFPEYTVANYFVDYLETNGIVCCKGPADLGLVFRPAEEDFSAPDFGEYFRASAAGGSGSDSGRFVARDGSFTILGSTLSPSLKAVVEVTNRDSNNMYAETLMKTLGREIAGDGTYLGAYRAEARLLSRLGVATGSGDGTLRPAGGVTGGGPAGSVNGGSPAGGATRMGGSVIRDGSGLSREDRVSAAFMCSLLRAMMRSPVYETFVGSLPCPGTGTLSSVLKGVPESDRPRIRMKSGSMGGVRCFSGYILPAGSSSSSSASASAGRDDTVIFSILVNNYSVPTYKIQRRIEEIIMLLTE